MKYLVDHGCYYAGQKCFIVRAHNLVVFFQFFPFTKPDTVLKLSGVDLDHARRD